MKRIALLIETSRYYGRSILEGIARYSHINGPFAFYSETSGRDKISYSEIKDWKIDGIIARDEKLDEQTLKSGTPTVVYVSRTDPNLYEYLIIAQNLDVGKMAAEHFLERKFEHFGYCGFSDVAYSKTRCQGYKNKLTENNIQVNVYTNTQSEIRHSWEDEQKRLCKWLSEIPKPAAIFACIDERARHVSEACKRMGYKVPDEVAILGVDNDNLVCELSNPPLSSIALNTFQGGYTAAKLLLDIIEGRQPESKKVLIQPLYVRIRQSTDILAIKDADILEAIRYIRLHANKAIQVDNVTDKVAVSRRWLEKKFLRITGRTLHEEIKVARAEKISQMLLTTNLSIQQIALTLGFNNSNNLARYYKQVKGVSCREFRNKYCNMDLNNSIDFK